MQAIYSKNYIIYASMDAYSPHKDTPITPEENSIITSFHTILVEWSAEIELIANIINKSRILYLSLLDIMSNTNHDGYID